MKPWCPRCVCLPLHRGGACCRIFFHEGPVRAIKRTPTCRVCRGSGAFPAFRDHLSPTWHPPTGRPAGCTLKWKDRLGSGSLIHQMLSTCCMQCTLCTGPTVWSRLSTSGSCPWPHLSDGMNFLEQCEAHISCLWPSVKGHGPGKADRADGGTNKGPRPQIVTHPQLCPMDHLLLWAHVEQTSTATHRVGPRGHIARCMSFPVSGSSSPGEGSVDTMSGGPSILTLRCGTTGQTVVSPWLGTPWGSLLERNVSIAVPCRCVTIPSVALDP